MATTARENDVRDVAVHAGGASPGVAGTEPTRRWSRVRASTWYPLLKKVVSVGAGMVGLSVIGLVAGAPERDRAQLMSISGDLGETWLAGAEPGTDHAAEQHEPVLTPAPPPPSNAQPHEAPAPSGAAGSGPAPSASAPDSPAPPQSGITADGKVILNLATAEELTRLPGIGQKRAEKIVELRERLGRFKKPSDLLRIKGIGPKSLRKMLPHLVLDPPSD